MHVGRQSHPDAAHLIPRTRLGPERQVGQMARGLETHGQTTGAKAVADAAPYFPRRPKCRNRLQRAVLFARVPQPRDGVLAQAGVSLAPASSPGKEEHGRYDAEAEYGYGDADAGFGPRRQLGVVRACILVARGRRCALWRRGRRAAAAVAGTAGGDDDAAAGCACG